MKRLCYRDEDTFFVFRYFLYFLIALFIIVILYNLATAKVFSFESIFKDFVIGAMCMIPFALLISLIDYLISAKKLKKYKEIKLNGKKTQGQIVGWTMDTGTVDTSDSYFVFVEYLDENENAKKFKTPALNFNPSWRLGSKECSVYLYKDEAYATDFVKAKKESERVFKGVKPMPEN